tara:strand:- start:1359 stop:1811 length:453 start_codon:yes stop_codon:yes gene_type:complete
LKITQPGIEDINSLVNFNIKMAKETENKILNKKIVTKGVSEVLTDTTLGYYVIAKNKNTILGSLMITYEWSDWRNGMFWWIQSVYVEKEYRQQGVYKQMYSYIKDKALKDNSCTGIRLYVEQENKIAQSVYTKLEMKETHYKLFEIDFQD